MDENGVWKNTRRAGQFLLSAKASRKVIRAKINEKLKVKNLKEYPKISQSLWEKPWVVYAKKPFGSPKSVVEYLGRGTHKMAISNDRITDICDRNVTFD